MSQPAIHNLVIMASAGSGKTHALNSRLIALLALGVSPERIVALTFTRAAAGEIFDELIRRLARAATEPARTRAENEGLVAAGVPALSAARYGELLRALIRGMHLSRIGTLDGFFAAVVRMFPLELGIAVNYIIMDGHLAAVTRERILRRILATPQTAAGQQACRDFAEVFRLSTFGEESKTVFDQLQAFAEERHGLYLRAPDPACWGQPDVIWPDGSPWHPPALDRKELEAETAALPRDLAALGADEEQERRWNLFGNAARNFSLAAVKDVGDLMEKLLVAAPDLERGSAVVTLNRRKMKLDGAICARVLKLLRHITGCMLEVRLRTTQGQFAILRQYEQEYDRLARRSGKLAFADLAHLLTRAEAPGAAAGPNEAWLTRQNIDYRMDGQYDHWALDEFQDTSRQQWAAVRNLVDEVIQDTSGARTFFMVGDVKQAIYGWRDGDSRLMQEIQAYYGLDTAQRDTSERSCPAVLDAVNAVFGNVARHPDLPEAVRDRWGSLWHRHEPSVRVVKHVGCCMLLETPKAAAGENPHADAVAAVLWEARPWERGIDAAVLVRGNDQGEALAGRLQDAGIPTVWESDKVIASDPVVAACLALFRHAAHPGDTLAGEHVRMTPLQALVHDLGLDPICLLERVFAHGFAGTVRFLIEGLAARGVDVDRPEIRAFAGSAQTFDLSGGRDGLEFAQYIESFTARDAPPRGYVRVMTIHHSKGLGFDMVILPMLPGRSSITRPTLSEGMLCQERSDPPGIEWLLEAPGILAEHDARLKAAAAGVVERECFEHLCVLYVAMTRARHGLYILVPPLPARAEALHPYTLVRAGLCPDGVAQAGSVGTAAVKVLYRNGDEGWHGKVVRADPAPRVAPIRLRGDAAAAARHVRLLPSHVASDTEPYRVENLFRQPGVGVERGAEFGQALHALFAQLEWVDTEPLDAVVSRWRAQTAVPDALAEAVAAHFRDAMGQSEIEQALRRPSAGEAALWRERSFDVILAGEWVTGTFDRVVATRDTAGKLAAIEVLDFKSNNVRNEAELEQAVAGYRAQVGLYRRALGQAFGVSPARVRASLLFTGPRRCVPVE
ncbi:MAG: hypothetical protein A3K19_23530 [Lentisphaerae bacterium RIFOXYB12_FULL_65_16]|nr:MAG: hypothetical protein A3K18_29275 [Lentisphaerae bacterium RIFOXYA12_64_32]OGV94070.1 MAG: hypothetical protein A3K19_23530 [Lentisphaerae bacterium RIFOXYB12_FULL_65_16]